MPFHAHRTWVIHPAESAESLAEKLIGHSWCSCAGWSLEGYLFLNDQTSPDGAFEVAIVKPPAEPGGQWWQVESITFGWFQDEPLGTSAVDKATDCIRDAIEGRYDPAPGRVTLECEPCDIETPEQHGRCVHCA